MNGFTSAILSLLLGWLRALLDQFWQLLNSESGRTFLPLLSLHWKTIFVVLCVGGFVLDRLIFFFRWRPDYVWSTKLGRLKRRFSRGCKQEFTNTMDYAGDWMSSPYIPMSHQTLHNPPMSYGTSLPQDLPDAFDSYALEDEDRDVLSYASVASVQDFAPMANQSRNSYEFASSPEDIRPVFDEFVEDWDGYSELPSPTYAPISAYEEPYEHTAHDLPTAYNEAPSEPMGYDVNTRVFVPPPSLEELPLNHTTPAIGDLVHPGLDLETFHQNIGLSIEDQIPGKGSPKEPFLKPPVDFPNTTYVPYYQETESVTDHRSKGALSSFAKKARNLVSIDNESNLLTIRDIQNPVNVKTAFHPPVMPRKLDDGDDM